jgi:hypothetical protein
MLLQHELVVSAESRNSENPEERRPHPTQSPQPSTVSHSAFASQQFTMPADPHSTLPMTFFPPYYVGRGIDASSEA